MINSAPRQAGKYNHGLYIPKNKEKIIKLNNQGGLYYRSSLEKKMMVYLDNNEMIKSWGAEHLRIPYKKTEWDSQLNEFLTTEHSYYPDFYYELIRPDGSISRVVAEVKPTSETSEPKLGNNPTVKQLKNFEYSLKMWNKNLSKWKYMIDYCDRKGFNFIVVTEELLGK